MSDPTPKTLGLFILTELACISAIALPSSPYRKLAFIPIALLAYLQLCVVGIEGGLPINTYAAAFRIACVVFIAFDYVLVTDAPKQLREIGDKTDISKASFFQRQIWAFKLLYNARNIGWSHEEPSHLPPRPQYTSRWAFIIARIKLWLFYLLLHDIQLVLFRTSPYFKVVPPVWDPRVFTDLYHFLWRVHLGISLFDVIFITLEIQTTLQAIVFVGLGLSDYQNWPHAFGSLWDAYTVRTFWGKTWHQMFRRLFSTPTNVIAKAIGLPRKGKFQRYFKTLLVFTFSGFAHQIADAVEIGSWTRPVIIYHFIAQAPMIMIEDGVIALGKRAGIKSSRLVRLLGYVYVLAWFCLLAPLWAATEVPAGHYDHRMQYSLVDGLWRGNWRPYTYANV